jgi:hypothetical protein
VSSRLEETARITGEFQLALLRIGVETVGQLLALWRRLSVEEKIRAGGRWAAEAEAIILTRRARARALGIAYYRLTSALMTGSTVPDPQVPLARNVTVGALRERWSEVIGAVPAAPLPAAVPQPAEPSIGEEAPPAPQRPRPAPAPPRPPEPGPDPDTGIDLSEEVPDDELVAVDSERIDDEATETTADEQIRDEVDAVVDNLGSTNLRRRNERIDTARPASEVDAERRDNEAAAGARTASGGARIAMDGARDVVHDLQESDRLAIGYARISLSGTPCGFCAMLISRGPVYKSFATGFKTAAARTVQAGQAAVGDEYHDNCMCTTVPVFSVSQYDNDPRFDLNREYERLWPQVTRGLSGKAALAAWRRYIRERQKSPQGEPVRVA